jgi:hypothetical protein
VHADGRVRCKDSTLDGSGTQEYWKAERGDVVRKVRFVRMTFEYLIIGGID